MKRLLALALPLGLLIAVSGCDDDGDTSDLFALTLAVSDTTGAPVSGLLLSVASDQPYYEDESAKAYATIDLTIIEPCSVRVTIEDVAGDEIRMLTASLQPAGSPQLVWDGRDDDQVHQTSGYYTARLRCLDPDTGELLFEDTEPMYMSMLDPERLSVGTTDANGEITLTDKRLFPYLYDAPDMPARNESGVAGGTMTFTASMRFQLLDPAGGSMLFYRDVTKSGRLPIVWNPDKADETSAAPALSPPDEKPPIEPTEFELGPIYPNPFN